jgi:hypothetical protein
MGIWASTICSQSTYLIDLKKNTWTHVHFNPCAFHLGKKNAPKARHHIERRLITKVPMTIWRLFKTLSYTKTKKYDHDLEISEFHQTLHKPKRNSFGISNGCAWWKVKIKQGVCHIVALPFTLKSIWRQKKNYENSNISPCQSIIFKFFSKRNPNPSRCYNSITTNLKFQHKPKYHLSKILI